MERGRQRQNWIDLLRGLAVIGMVWTHAANAFLDTRLQKTALFEHLTFAHGLVAPLFFWVAGYMRGLSAARLAPVSNQGQSLRRLLVVLGLGYLLHLPLPSLLRGDFSRPVLEILFQSDVLQALAISCLLLLAVERARLSIRGCLMVVLGLGMAILLVAQFGPNAEVGFLPVDAYLNSHSGSQFPLFPWAAFACAGFIVGRSGTMSWKLFCVSVLAAWVLPQVPHRPDVISFFFERLGWVTMLAVVIQKGADALQASWLRLAGRESLCVYVTHLALIYWLPVWRGSPLATTCRTNQPWALVGVLFMGLVTVSMALAWLNEHRKKRGSTR